MRAKRVRAVCVCERGANHVRERMAEARRQFGCVAAAHTVRAASACSVWEMCCQAFISHAFTLFIAAACRDQQILVPGRQTLLRAGITPHTSGA